MRPQIVTPVAATSTTVIIGYAYGPRKGTIPLQRVSVSGTFNGADATIQYTEDGSTYVDAQDVSGNALVFDAAGGRNLSLMGKNEQNPLTVVATITGSTAPNLTFTFTEDR